ncbi:MAG TPA: hypothetical protein PKD59_01930 [Miltoncostaeaceae bacterium]|nr:hypothetical protein [Miltoncostaeaceae bacterium]
MAVRSTRGRLVLIGAGAIVATFLVPSMASAATTKVLWGDFANKPPTEFTAQYPHQVTVSRGDKVQWTILGFHTVVVTKKGNEKKLPALVGPSSTLNPPFNDPAGAPYWWGGTTPLIQLNGRALSPSGGTTQNGKKTIASGALNGNTPKFTVTFTKNGTYTIRCVVHPGMRGTVKVVDDSGDTAKKQRQRAVTDKTKDAKAINTAVTKAGKGNGTTITIGPGTANGGLFGFAPATESVPVGSTVTFKMGGKNEVHTASFGPEAFLSAVAKKTYEGSGADVFGEGAYPSDNPALGPPAVTPTSHGNGFVSSGALQDPGIGFGLPSTFTVTFPVAGTYQYHCLVHFDMKGTITVG